MIYRNAGQAILSVAARWREATHGSEVRVTSLVVGAYCCLRLYAFLGATIHAASDTGTYTAVSDKWSILDPSFYGAPRPFVLPLLYELVGSQTAWAWAQWLIATGAWIVLSVVVASGISSRPLRFVALTAMLALSLAQPVTVWDRVLLSESLTVSLGVLLLAILVLTLRRSTPARVAWAAFTLFLLAFVRDANAPVGALLFLLLAAALLISRRRALAGAFVLIAITVLVVSQVSANAGKRWEFSMFNVIGTRVLPSPEVRDYFVDHGMPYDESVRRMSGYYASTKDYALYNNRPLLIWMRAEGRSVYLSFLLTHPGYLVYWPASDRELLAPTAWSEFSTASISVLPEPVEAAVYPSSPGRAVFLVVVVLGLAAAFFRLRSREWLVPAAVLLSTPPHLMFVWHADAMEVGRHSVFASIFLRVGALWLLILVIDAAVSRWRARAAVAEPDHQEAPAFRRVATTRTLP